MNFEVKSDLFLSQDFKLLISCQVLVVAYGFYLKIAMLNIL